MGKGMLMQGMGSDPGPGTISRAIASSPAYPVGPHTSDSPDGHIPGRNEEGVISGAVATLSPD